jgi:hypothetical protein
MMSEQPPDDPSLNSRDDDEPPQDPADSGETPWLRWQKLDQSLREQGNSGPPEDLPPQRLWWHPARQNEYEELQDKYGELQQSYIEVQQHARQGLSDYMELDRWYRIQYQDYQALVAEYVEGPPRPQMAVDPQETEALERQKFEQQHREQPGIPHPINRIEGQNRVPWWRRIIGR